MPHIDYYFTTVSPYAYLVGPRLEEIAQRRGATVTYKPVDLISTFGRTGGVPLPERHPARVEYRAQELPRQARRLNMPFNLKPAHWPVNPAPSAYAIIAAQKAGGGNLPLLVHRLLASCWAEEKDVSQDDVIKACLAEADFDPGLADSGLLTGAEIYAANLEEAVAAGVFGSPFFICDSGQKFWGQDRLDDLDAHLGGDI
ncbi:MAG: 2-hydroxychromene-2-carboxylate isomerase [Pseudomonadota bacterium]|jgi:2-hydroxychromene-2-carboxylate isomerase|uniref:2-hydroxychromene-2-carboxylate isomerase n=1 Tax=Thalassovita autumnalis TaxID=2072972 RepID=A0A0P1GEW8_9RHOB|nr:MULTISPECIES: 2-hydroxychromene-2-carboxylate isomerase [Thalassovita]MEC8293535.1 2-hydroxychromene-2-carboxylate isomerase [Pseudomonadota bacterium]CUH69281.1 2-hydroxychromene-2-carboxylate isomerase [Thalassovita autumnalis]CUH74203.1 2-hydroxychromene-2-carboxylate isomerase [Thalassovita autumnalis]